MLISKQIPFATPIWTSLVEVTEPMVSKCVEFIDNNPSVSISNKGGYQSKNILSEEFKNEFTEILGAVVPTLKNIIEELKTDLLLSSAWINENGKGDFNMPHIHPNSSFSAILYIKAPEDCGNLVFKNPTSLSAYPIKDTILGFCGAWEVAPKEGLFCVFPSYLEHYVEPSKSDSKRISVAFNFLQV